MMVRIVKMEFKPECITTFCQLFDERKELIRNFAGCRHLELWQQTDKSNVFFTYSYWESEAHLEHYRYSTLFKETWTLTKALFAQKAEAWSVDQRVMLP